MSSISGILKKPAGVALIAGVVGIILGLIWGWGIQPVQWVDAGPSMLRQDYQVDYLRMAIDSYGTNHDASLAIRRYQALGQKGPDILRLVMADSGNQNPMLIAEFGVLVNQAAGATNIIGTTTGATPATPTQGNKTVKYLLIGIGVVAVGAVFYLGAKVLRPMVKRSGTPTAAQQALEFSRQTERTDYAALGEEPPLTQFVTTYVLGDDLFDDSFSIETGAGEFLGECGVGISETIGVTENPKRVSAFEVWLFDKSDIQTVTKVLMSEHAYNDPNTLGRLQAKGEPVLIEKGKRVVLETAAIQMVATITDIEYGRSALPENSFFERLTLELAIWPKAAA